ncbi:MAG: EboA domain-containing protein, partial [Planctomycetota bacterium]|nr:EboA domain-containing protein [Planctomycetota bacterium]
DEAAAASAALEGWNPERWSTLEAMRVALLLVLPELDGLAGEQALEEAFRYADDGELCALYRSLALWPNPERFSWRAAEGCRTNIVPVFEAVALDTPYPVKCFDDVAWRQAAIKAIFIDAPLWRMWGLDTRLSPELARMALDLADERRSAHRCVQHELWLCLGPHGGERGLESLEQELGSSNTLGRRAAAYGLARAGAGERLRALLSEESDAEVAEAMRDALAGNTSQEAFRALDPTLQGAS